MSTFAGGGEKDLKAVYHTLGCKLNFAETSMIAGKLADAGVREARKDERPDVCVVNTCSVTEVADKKARTLLRRLVRKFPEAFVIVTGCYAQLKYKEIAEIEGVDLILGAKAKLNETYYIRDFKKLDKPQIEVDGFSTNDIFQPSCSRGDRTRFFLKVQDGCDYFCTYCTIPFARGRSRSGTVADLVEQARNAAMEGGKEVVITGVNIGDFGKNTRETFFELIKALDKVEGIERFRISSIEPNLITDEIMEWIAGESRAFMPHFHIPLQSGSDAVLRKMNRRYNTALFASKIEKIRSLIPDAFIGVDVIVGARGETETEWENSYNFIAGLPVSRLHVFPYSERVGTAALSLAEGVSREERLNRARKLIELSGGKLTRFMTDCIGQHRKVLWEQPIVGSGLMSGLTDNYLRVVAPAKGIAPNSITTVRLDVIDATRPETITASHI